MKKQLDYKLILLITMPFLVAEVINRLIGYGFNRNSSFAFTTSEYLLFMWKYVAVVFWFWAGRKFGSAKDGKIGNFILGNLMWIVSMTLFIWQFIFVSGENRQFFIAGISQNYMLGFVSWASRAIYIFSNTTNTTTVGITAYLMMFIVFSIGFFSAAYKQT